MTVNSVPDPLCTAAADSSAQPPEGGTAPPAKVAGVTIPLPGCSTDTLLVLLPGCTIAAPTPASSTQQQSILCIKDCKPHRSVYYAFQQTRAEAHTPHTSSMHSMHSVTAPSHNSTIMPPHCHHLAVGSTHPEKQAQQRRPSPQVQSRRTSAAAPHHGPQPPQETPGPAAVPHP